MSANHRSIRQMGELCMAGSRLEEAVINVTMEKTEALCDPFYLDLLREAVSSQRPEFTAEMWSYLWIRFANTSPMVSEKSVVIINGLGASKKCLASSLAGPPTARPT